MPELDKEKTDSKETREYPISAFRDASESYELDELRFRALEDYEYPEDYLLYKKRKELRYRD